RGLATNAGSLRGYAWVESHQPIVARRAAWGADRPAVRSLRATARDQAAAGDGSVHGFLSVTVRDQAAVAATASTRSAKCSSIRSRMRPTQDPQPGRMSQ